MLSHVLSPSPPAAAEGLKLKRLMMEDLRRAVPAAVQQWPSSASATRPLLSPATSIAHVPFLPQTPRSSQPPSRTPRSRPTSAAAERPAPAAQPPYTPRTRPQSAGPARRPDPAPGWTRPVSAGGLRATVLARRAPTWGPGSPRQGNSLSQPAVAWATSGEVREARVAAQLQRHIVDSDVAEQQLRLQLHLLLLHADAGADADAGVGVAQPLGTGSHTKERWSPLKNVSAPFTLPDAAAAVAVAGAGRAAAAAKAENEEVWAEAAVVEVALDDEGGEELEAAGLSAAASEGLRVHSHPYVERLGERPLDSGPRLRTPRAPVYKDWGDAPHGR